MDIAIKATNVTKTYRIFGKPTDRLKQLLNKKGRYYKEFPALKPISFEISKGEAVGIIGRNGSGKSTLLQMIAGTLTPTQGNILVNGRISALLELGSGFNPEFTGRENIYLNGAILGLGKGEMDNRLENILKFADIGDFIDQPVKTYSSGMYVRLAFAVSINVDPDVLIVDEALAVGDGRFQLKCYEKIKALKKEGKTILVVSHDLQTIRQICDRVMLIDKGEFIEFGNPNDVVNHYTKVLFSNTTSEFVEESVDESEIQIKESDNDAFQGANTIEEKTSSEYRYGSFKGIIEQCFLLNTKGQPVNSFTTGEEIEVVLNIKALKDIVQPIYAITIKSVKGLEVYGTNTYFQNMPFEGLKEGETATIHFKQSMKLMPGDYFVSLGFVELADGDIEPLDRRYDVFEMKILPQPGDRSFGIANLETEIKVTHSDRLVKKKA